MVNEKIFLKNHTGQKYPVIVGMCVHKKIRQIFTDIASMDKHH